MSSSDKPATRGRGRPPKAKPTQDDSVDQPESSTAADQPEAASVLASNELIGEDEMIVTADDVAHDLGPRRRRAVHNYAKLLNGNSWDEGESPKRSRLGRSEHVGGSVPTGRPHFQPVPHKTQHKPYRYGKPLSSQMMRATDADLSAPPMGDDHEIEVHEQQEILEEEVVGMEEEIMMDDGDPDQPGDPVELKTAGRVEKPVTPNARCNPYLVANHNFNSCVRPRKQCPGCQQFLSDTQYYKHRAVGCGKNNRTMYDQQRGERSIGMECPDCLVRIVSADKFCEHMSKFHNRHAPVQRALCKNMDEAEALRAEVEAEGGGQLIYWNNFRKTTHYRCNRIHDNRPKRVHRPDDPNVKRRAGRGSIKTEKSCTSFMRRDEQPDGTFLVTWCATHLHDTMETQLPRQTRQRIIEMTRSGFEAEAIQNKLVEELINLPEEQLNSAQRRVLTCTYDEVRRIRRKAIRDDFKAGLHYHVPEEVEELARANVPWYHSHSHHGPHSMSGDSHHDMSENGDGGRSMMGARRSAGAGSVTGGGGGGGRIMKREDGEWADGGADVDVVGEVEAAVAAADLYAGGGGGAERGGPPNRHTLLNYLDTIRAAIAVEEATGDAHTSYFLDNLQAGMRRFANQLRLRIDESIVQAVARGEFVGDAIVEQQIVEEGVVEEGEEMLVEVVEEEEAALPVDVVEQVVEEQVVEEEGPVGAVEEVSSVNSADELDVI